MRSLGVLALGLVSVLSHPSAAGDQVVLDSEASRAEGVFRLRGWF